MNIDALMKILEWLDYAALAGCALWGAFCVVVVWRRIQQQRFRNEDAQAEFMDQIDDFLIVGDFDSAIELCEEDGRAVPQLVHLALTNRDLGYNQVRHFVADRFQRDILSDLEYRLSWVQTCIKSAPMLGLFGTVLGMVGAFGKLAAGGNVEATSLAGDISFALYTTAYGLAIAIPLIFAVAAINIRIRKLEDLVGLGLKRLFDTLKPLLTQAPVGGR
ncbi:MAG: MotA/TolQ/ExbB proton channel family protein [Pirellulales bacterium]|nr:MotA/TolQ/ExbB proton channel family protein [Pirellulales bacterium]